MSIKYTDILTKYKRLFWQPTTKLGNPLFKRSEANQDKQMLTIEEKDPEYNKLISKKWSSPSNVRALFIGVNKAFAIYHRGLSEGNNKVSELTINDPELSWMLFDESGKEAPSLRSLHLYTRKNLDQNKETQEIFPKDINVFEDVEYTNNPIESVFSMFALPNVEMICVTWNAFCPLALHKKAEKEILSKLFAKSPRLEKIYYIPESMDKYLGKGMWENNIREYAQDRNTSITQFIPEIQQFEIFSKEVDFNKPLALQRNYWIYDEFLSKINDEDKKDVKGIAEEPENNLTELKNFKANFEGNNGRIVMRRTDYTVTLSLCKPEEIYYNKFEDVEYKSDPKKLVLTGVLGEKSLISLSKAIKKYVKINDKNLSIEDFNSLGSGLLKVKPKLTSDKVWAYQVPISQSDKYYVQTSSGDKLKVNASKNTHGEDLYHAQGDWIVCYSDEQGKMNSNDCAVVNGVIFEKIYTDWQEIENLNKETFKIFEDNGWKVPDEFTESLYQQMLEEMKG